MCLLLSDSMTLSQCAMPQALSSHLWTTAYLPHMEKNDPSKMSLMSPGPVNLSHTKAVTNAMHQFAAQMPKCSNSSMNNLGVSTILF